MDPDSPDRVSPVGAGHFFPEYFVSTMLSLSRDQVSARLCLPPGRWAGHNPRGAGGSWVRKASLVHPLLSPAHLAHPSLTQCSGTVAVSVRDCPHHLPGRTGNSSLLGAFPERHKPNSVRPTSKCVPDHLESSMLATFCHQEHPSCSTQPIPQSRVIAPSPSSDSAKPQQHGPCSASLTKTPTRGWAPE